MHPLLLAAVLALAPRKTSWDGEPRSIPGLVARATVIVVGTGEVKRQVGVTAFVVLRRQRTLKGNVAGWVDDAQRFEVLWEAGSDPGPLAGRVHGLWFLTRDAQGHWFILPPFERPVRPEDVAVPLPPERPPRPATGTPVIDAVADELWEATRAPDAEMADRASSALIGILDGDPQPRSSAANPSVLAHLATLGSRHWAGCPIARFAREWEVLRLERVERYLRAHPKATDMPWLRSWPPNLCRAEEVETLPILARLLADRIGADHQRCFAQAVASLHTEAALAVLGRLFDRPERSLQQLAVDEVSAHAQQATRQDDVRYPPAAPPERTGDDALAAQVAFWRTWLAAHLAVEHPPRRAGGGSPTRALVPDHGAPRVLGPSVRLTLVLPPGDRLGSWPARWPAPAACRVDTDLPRPEGWVKAIVTECDARRDGGIEVAFERHLCEGCWAAARVTLQDAWGERTSIVLFVIEPPRPTPPPAVELWLVPPRPTPRPVFDLWLVPPRPTPAPAAGIWVVPPRPTPGPDFGPWLVEPSPTPTPPGPTPWLVPPR